MKNKKTTILPWIWYAFCVGFLLIFLSNYLDVYINPDSASEMILANDMAKKGFWIFDEDWLYSTEIRVLNTQVIFSILFRFISSWHYVRLFGTIIAIGIMELTFAILLRSIGFGELFPILGGILLLPLSSVYLHIILVGTYYTLYIAVSFLTMAILMQLCYKKCKMSTNAILIVVLFTVSLLTGMVGMRQFLVLYIPMTISSCVVFILNNSWIFKYTSSDYVRLKEMKKNDSSCKFFVGSIFTTIAALIGYCINKKVLINIYHFSSYSDTTWVQPSADRIMEVLNSWIEVAGYVAGEKLISVGALCNVVALGLCIIVLLYYKKYYIKENNERNTQLTTFFAIAVIIFTIINILNSIIYTSRYCLPIAVFGIIIVTLLYLKLNFSVVINRVCLVFGVIIVLTMSYMSVSKTYDELSPEYHENMELVSFLEKNDFYNGYATYWNGNVFTELSNGKIEIWAMANDVADKTSMLYQWSQKADHANREPEGKVFFITNAKEHNNEGVFGKLDDNQLIYSSANYLVYGYNSYNSLPTEIRE